MLYSALNELLYGDSLLHIERFETGRVHSLTCVSPWPWLESVQTGVNFTIVKIIESHFLMRCLFVQYQSDKSPNM